MNKINPFESKAIKFDTKEQLDHLAELAWGYGLETEIAFEPDYFFFRKDIYGGECYFNYDTPYKLPEILYSEFIKGIEAVKESDTPDMVNHPSHYNVNGIEVIDVIKGYKLCYLLGNVIKYVLRSNFKGNKKQDLQKAAWYLNSAISELE